MLLRHANDDSGDVSADIQTILDEATGSSPKRTLWISSILFAELRPSSLAPQARFQSVDELARYIRSIATVVVPDPNIMLMAARLRDIDWSRPKRMPNEKPRRLTLGDAVHLSSAIWVKKGSRVNDLEFLTFDNSSKSNSETGPGTKPLPLLSVEDYCDGISDNSDAMDVLRLVRVKPILRQPGMGLS